MTIDEAIKHAREKERQHRENAEYQINRNINSPQVSLHIEVETRKSDEARQLAEWLEELKQLRKEKCIATIKVKEDDLQKVVDKALEGFEVNIQYNVKEIRNKAIDDFVKKLEEHQQENWIDNLEYGITFSDIEQVAEQLKVGGVE